MRNRRYRWLIVGVGILAGGCCKSESGTDSKPGDITIEKGADGGLRVTGGKKMTGDAKDCAALKACCTAPQAALFCGLAEASGQDCKGALDSVRSFLKEQNVPPPAGCQ